MCGGSKGQSQSNQVQTYQPNPQATSAITGAMNTAQNTASLPFNLPQAPVAGFSPDQLAAFQSVNNAQGIANPYINTAGGYFNQSAQAPNINQFFNPFASAVGANMQNLFGQQMSQTTGQLTQAAGGVGADRIAVGQGNLANQQALAEGQTMAGLYQPSLQAAQNEQQLLQGAGYGTAALGNTALNTALTGAQAELGTGGLQQQLSQAQLNAPYQLQVAQAMFPYQQSNFLTNSIASLAPGLGGTTYGTGNYTPAQPSIFSQVLGAGIAGAGIYGGMGGFGGGGVPASALGTAQNPLPGLNASDDQGYGPGGNLMTPFGNFGAARGGAIHNPFADGGSVYSGAGGVSDQPIDIASGIVPASQTAKIAPHIPSLNLNPPSQSQSGNGAASLANLASVAGKIGAMFAARGGSIPTYDAGGMTFDDRAQPVQDAIASGDFDPVGVNETTFAAPSMPSPAHAPAIAADDGDTTTPPSASPASGLLPSAPSDDSSDSPDFMKSPWAALTAAGLGIMGGSSPYAGVNIGQGGLQGIKTLEEQRAASQKDETIEQGAQRLMQEAEQHAEEMGLKREELGYKKQLLTGTLLDDDSARLAAEQYVTTGTMPPLGYGQTANQNRALVWSKVNQIAAERGMTGADLAAAKADFMGQQAGARTAGVRGANVDMAIEEARRTFPIAIAASDALPRGSFVPWNKAVQMVQADTSSPELAKFVTANQAVITAYSQAMSRTGANSVHAQSHAENLLSTVTSPEAYRAVLEQMETEMAAAKAAPESVRQSIQGRISGRQSAAPTAGASSGFTGRTAINRSTGERLRETTSGQWVP